MARSFTKKGVQVLEKKRFEYLGTDLTNASLIKACESLVAQGHTPETILVPNGTAKGRKKVTIVTSRKFLFWTIQDEILVIIRIEPENMNYGAFHIEYTPKAGTERKVSHVHVP